LTAFCRMSPSTRARFSRMARRESGSQ
jgi:hypothetical protein